MAASPAIAMSSPADFRTTRRPFACGARIYPIGFAPDKNVDPKTYFELKGPLSADNRLQFLPVSDYERIFKAQP